MTKVWGAMQSAAVGSLHDLGRSPFVWHTFDLRPELPPGWQETILDVAQRHAKSKELVPTSVTSREASRELRIPVMTVAGLAVAEHLPWLEELYRVQFRALAQTLTAEPVLVAQDKRYGINLNIQRGTGMRYELHVDSNPLEGLLYVTDHPMGSGGELVVANRGDVIGKEEVDQDAARVYPVAGYLILFDARRHTHYVNALASPESVRVVAAMNFYTPSCPESARPPDLNRHLFGENLPNHKRS